MRHVHDRWSGNVLVGDVLVEVQVVMTFEYFNEEDHFMIANEFDVGSSKGSEEGQVKARGLVATVLSGTIVLVQTRRVFDDA